MGRCGVVPFRGDVAVRRGLRRRGVRERESLLGAGEVDRKWKGQVLGGGELLVLLLFRLRKGSGDGEGTERESARNL